MNPIDDIFNKGLSGKGKEYAPEQWQEVEKLLEPKKRFWLTTSFKYAVLLILAAATTVWLLTVDQTKDIVQKQEDMRSSEPSSESTTKTEPTLEYTEELTIDQDVTSLPDQEAKPHLPREKQQVHDQTTKVLMHSTPRRATENPEMHDFYQSERVFGSGDSALAMNDDLGNREITEEVRRTDVVFEDLGLQPYDDVLLVTSEGVNLEEIKRDKQGKKQAWSMSLSPYYMFTQYDRNYSVMHIGSLKQSETALNRPGMGLDFALNKGNWMVKTGVSFVRFAERTNYTTTGTNWAYDTTLVLVKRKYTQSPRGKDIALVEKRVDSVGTRFTVNACPDCEVEFRYTSIPLKTGYVFRNKWFDCFVEAGGAVSFLSSTKGVYTVRDVPMTDNAFNLSDLETVNELNKSVLSVGGSVGVRRRFTSLFGVWASYGYETGIGSMMVGYDQRWGLQQARFGVEITW
ncbi:MAG: hypothetical protein JJ975_12570 [Bacteroidia bacterium]|nr:hypothetical protein [Bacteroidia bacterium]